MDMDTKNAITNYHSVTDKIFATTSEKPGENTAIDLLLLRQEISQRLNASVAGVDREDLSKVVKCDQKVKSELRRVHSLIAPAVLEQWKQTLLPSESHWWWQSPPMTVTGWKIVWGWVRSVLLLLLWIATAVSLAYILEMLRRLLGSDPDPLSVTLQGALGLLAISTIFETSRQWFWREKSSKDIQTPSSAWMHYGLITLSITAAIMLSLTQSTIADYIHRQGNNAAIQGDIRKAIAQYERSLRLDSNNAVVHYNLASAQEEVLDFDTAEAEYRLAAISGLEGVNTAIEPFACSRLATLLIRRKKDYQGAYAIASRGIDKQSEIDQNSELLAQQNQLIKTNISKQTYLNANAKVLFPTSKDTATDAGLLYCLYRDRARTRLELNEYAEAIKDSEMAVKKRPEQPAAHFIWGQSANEMRKYDDAIEHFQYFFTNQNSTEQYDSGAKHRTPDEIEPDWAKIARTVLFKKSDPPKKIQKD